MAKMDQLIVSGFLCLLFISCEQGNEKTEAMVEEEKRIEQKEYQLQTPDTLIKKDVSWADQYIHWYLEQEAEKLKTNNSLSLSFLKDHQIRQGRECVQVRIGYDLGQQFEVRKWLYIDYETHHLTEYIPEGDSLRTWPIREEELHEIPSSGTYRYDIAFAEWQGKSMGEKVSIIIQADSIKVRYEGDGQLTLTEKGEIIDEGLLRKHVSGKWIITTEEADVYLEEVGGCTGGPAIVDFMNKKYWIC